MHHFNQPCKREDDVTLTGGEGQNVPMYKMSHVQNAVKQNSPTDKMSPKTKCQKTKCPQKQNVERQNIPKVKMSP